MADAIKVLGQAAPGATTETDLYTVPNLTQTTCSSLVVCNRSTAATFRVSVSVDDAATANTDYLYYDAALGDNATVAIVLGLTLGQNDTVRVYASSANLSFNLFGVETS